MIKRAEEVGLRFRGLHVVLLCCLAYSTVAFGGEKEYPLEGKVVALGTSQEMTGGSGPLVVNGQGSGTGVSTQTHRTYTVKSQTRVYVLECPYWMTGFHIHSPSECGGTKKIEIGDVIHFRMAKNHAYIQTDKGKEQKLSVLSEAANEGSVKEWLFSKELVDGVENSAAYARSDQSSLDAAPILGDLSVVRGVFNHLLATASLLLRLGTCRNRILEGSFSEAIPEMASKL
jgi:Cu/Zn superoxide dismutase